MSVDPLAGLMPTTLYQAPERSAPTEDQAFHRVMAQQLVTELTKSLNDEVFGGATGALGALFNQHLSDMLAGSLAEAPGVDLAPSASLLPTSPLSASVTHLHSLHPGVPEMVSPVPLRVTSDFGERFHPVEHVQKMHHGLDLAGAEGDPIRSAASGTVTFAGEKGGYGNVVIVDHGDGVETRYAHCASLSVEEGQSVQAGQSIATVGSTGRSTGPHLHFELRMEGKAVDPLPYLQSGEGSDRDVDH